MSAARGPLGAADLVVAGAGIVGLSVAWEGVRRGLSVAVVERDARPSGASVRNFGHGCVTAQTGTARAYGELARERWLELRDRAGLWVQECGTVVVARSATELAVISEFVQAEPASAELLDAAGVRAHLDVPGTDIVGGAFLRRDLRIDPRAAVPAFAEYLRSLGVRFHFSTAAVGADTGVLRTSRGDLAADYVALTLGHDLDQLLPEPSDAAGLRRCQLHMLRVAAPAGFRLAPAVLTGTSLLRYDGFLACPSSTALRQELEAEAPALIAAGVNLMFVQHPSGDLIVGDSHVYDATPAPFADEELDALLLHEAGRLLGVAGFTVKERWLGTYASTPSGAYLTPRPAPGVVGAAVTSGIGMTTALGLAPSVLDALIASSDASVH